MSKKRKQEHRSAWTIDMLEKVRDTLLKGSSYKISFNIQSRIIVMSLNKSLRHHTHFFGESKDLEGGVSFALNPLDKSKKEYQEYDYLGYIDFLNDVSKPTIRAFVKESTPFFESIGKMAIESRMLNSKELIAISIEIDVPGLSDLRDVPAKNMLTMKLPIKSIFVAQKDSFV